MDDAALMCRGKSADDLLCVIDRLAQRYRTFVQTIAKLLPDQQLRNNEVGSVLRVDIIDPENVRMAQAAGGLSLTLESFDALIVRREVRGQNLDGDLSIYLWITRAIDLAHSARSEQRTDLVPSKCCSFF